MDANEKAQQAMQRADEASQQAMKAADTAGVPWTLVESTASAAADLWAKAADACRVAGMDREAKRCARQARALTFG